MDEVLIYQSEDQQVKVQVTFTGESVWLNRQQLAVLFDRDIKTIGKHINSVFREEELDKNSVVAKFATTARDGKTYSVEHYNLDLIISVGYRVKSRRGTQFRIWATQRLRDYLVQGAAINQQRLEQLQKTIEVIEKSSGRKELQLSEAKGLLALLSRYTKSFVLLNRFDSSSLKEEHLTTEITFEISYREAKKSIEVLKQQLITQDAATELFGKEKDQGFKSSLQAIVQTFDGQYLYGSIEEQAANLLYFVIKNHSFADGNKRIGAFLFIWFLEKNKYALKKSGDLKINDNGLTALALLIAQSNPADKDLMIQLVINLINDQ